MKAFGYPVLVWTVNEPEDIKRVLAMEPEGLITDNPVYALEARENMRQ